MTKLFTILLVSVLCAGFALAQGPINPPASNSQKPAPSPTPVPDVDIVKITTNLVQVDAVVTDKNGKVVPDLRPDEVEIFEDGKSQKITNFSFVSLAATEASTTPGKPDKTSPPLPPVPLRPEQVRRTIALVVDDLGLSFESTYQVKRALKKFVEEQVQPGDLVAIIRTGGGVGALQQFTSDPRQLYAAIERVKWSLTNRSGVGAFAPIGSSLSDELAEAEKKLDDFRDEIFSVGTLGAIDYVIRGMKDLPGRKSLVLFSDGLRIFNREDPTASSRILAALRSLTDRANRASVVIYTLDARGLPVLGFTAADSPSFARPDELEQQLSERRSNYFDSQNGLFYLSERTGGFLIHDTNDLGSGIRKVMEDQKSYYLIGYRPDDSTFELVSGRRKFHKLNLKVRRPGKFNVRIRNGFYGVSDDETAKMAGTPRQRLYNALMSPFGSADIHMRLTSFFANNAKYGSLLRSMLHIRAKDLVFKEQPDGSHQAVIDVVVVAFGDNGLVIDQVARTHTIELKGKVYELAMREGFIYNVTMPIKKAGAYQLRTALRDRNSELIGSATQFVEVPDIKKNRLLLSGIVMRGMSLESYKKLLAGGTQEVTGADDSIEEAPAGTSAALREFRQGMALVYGVEIYNAQVNKTTGKVDLEAQPRVFRNGQQLFNGNVIPFDAGGQTDMKRVTLVGAIHLGTDMQPGEYVLQLIVTDRLAKEKNRIATQWISFDVVGR